MWPSGVNRVKTELAAIQQTPEGGGLEFRHFHDTSVDVRQGLTELGRSGLIGGGLAIVFMFLFLRKFRTTLLVALAGENSAERLDDAQGRRRAIEAEFALLGGLTETRQGQEFGEILAASLPEPPAWFEQGRSTRGE